MRPRIWVNPKVTVSGGGGGGPSTGNISIGPDFGDGQSSVTMSIGTVTVSGITTDQQNTKDVYWPDISLCPDDTNKDGANIQIEGVIATRKAGASGWDVSSYLTGTVVSSATARFVAQTVPITVNGNDRCRLITTGTEGWSETTAICSNHPTDDGEAASPFVVTSALNGGAVGNVYTMALNSTARSRLANRMGVSTFSLILDSTDNTTTNHAFYDLENGSSTQRPLLTFSWSKTL